MSTLTDRTALHRLPERGRHERDDIDAILDEALTGQLAFVHDGQPFALPTIHARIGDQLYLHGSAASRMLRTATGEPVCYTVHLIDGLVVARTGFHHSMNYRSVMVLGVPRVVDDPDEKLTALDAIVDHVLPGRAGEVRAHTDKELRATRVLALGLTEASAKVRTGDPVDEPEDVAGDAWAGIVPIRTVAGEPYPAADLRPGITTPASVARRRAALGASDGEG